MISGIYKITNKITGKSYIGKSKDIFKRFEQHMAVLSYDDRNKWTQDLLKYKPTDYTFEILEIAKNNKLEKSEADYIELYDTYNNGYNSNSGEYSCEIKEYKLNKL